MYILRINYMGRELILKSGKKLANDYVRVVKGGRGDYVEFKIEDIATPIIPLFKHNKYYGYYIWATPEDSNEKIYFQLKPVSYADYKPGLFYISPKDLLDFNDIDPQLKLIYV